MTGKQIGRALLLPFSLIVSLFSLSSLFLSLPITQVKEHFRQQSSSSQVKQPQSLFLIPLHVPREGGSREERTFIFFAMCVSFIVFAPPVYCHSHLRPSRPKSAPFRRSPLRDLVFMLPSCNRDLAGSVEPGVSLVPCGFG
jgi:hypothetical protein